MVLHIAAVFCMSAAVGILYRIPRSSLVYASVTGVAAWLVMAGFSFAGHNLIRASFFASLTVGILAEFLARLLKKPATVYIIPGFIPLVPGREAYTTVLLLLRRQYVEGISMGMQTLLTGGAIAFGIFISSIVYRLAVNYIMRRSL
ncbi:threonine/serine exporter thre [Lucifera butyrica]|uniref:Threonine/serine exporter thre n=1 Tax=Lucifera butyrica TaxID=1351585 RepID=A0A498R6C1_9FIRM|nr:threonine/serine exporter family protein [Lucifera butyrica]VBB06407.1 threonine/serine exporter thre [Lucifera butyrica]